MLFERMQEILIEDLKAVAARDLPWHKLSGQRVLVTGATGFLGGYLARTLLALHQLGKIDQPVQVVALVRSVKRAQACMSDLIGHPHFELLEWDLNRIAVPHIGACNYVLHAASQASPRFYGTDPVGTIFPNAVGTAALLEALQQGPDPRGFLFISSSEVYGTVPGGVSLAETNYGTLDPASVRACYAESKRLGETLCVAWTEQHKTPTYIVRPFHTYGPGLQEDDGRVFADFAFSVLRGENIVMMSDGSARRSFCYATDAIAGFFAVLLIGQPALPYNVANSAGELSVIELAELLIALYPEKRLAIERRQRTGNPSYLASTFSRLMPDVSRLAALGWRAEITPAQGFRRMIDAYQK